MTVKQLIKELIELPMNSEVVISMDNPDVEGCPDYLYAMPKLCFDYEDGYSTISCDIPKTEIEYFGEK